MLPEHFKVQHSHNVVIVSIICLVQVLQDIQLNAGLVLESLFVPDYLDSYHLVQFVVEAFDSLAKAAATKFI